MSPVLNRQQKITFAEMRASGVRGLLIYCADYKCSHYVTMIADHLTAALRARPAVLTIPLADCPGPGAPLARTLDSKILRHQE